MALGKWQKKFNKLFSQLDHSWNLEQVNDIVREIGWLKVQHKGKATFKCSTCDNEWISVSSGVVFYYRLSSSDCGQHGEVRLFVGMQKCINCNELFEAAEWDNKGMECAITKVLNEVKEKIYNLSIDKKDVTDVQARFLELHQKNFGYLCQLCSLGICQEIELGKNINIQSISSDVTHV